MRLGPRLLGLVAILTAAWAGACARPATTQESQTQAAAPRGKSVYEALCAPCHDVSDLHLIKDPPKLDGLFAKQKLPSGALATDQEVRNVILHGRGIMPPFENSLTSDDVDALIQYLHTR